MVKKYGGWRAGIASLVTSVLLHMNTASAIPVSWHEDLIMSRGHIEHYFRTTFREHSYGTYCGNHLLDFLSYASTTRNPVRFTTKIVDLFHIRMKEALWSNPYVVNTVLQGLYAYVGPTLEMAEADRADKVQKTLYDMLSNRFEELKQDPDNVLASVTDEILTIVDGADATRLRSSAVRLVENMLDRLVWLLAEQEEAWDVTCALADNLYRLYEADIIPDTITLNQCLWSIMYRFTYCIETTGDTISIMTYQRIKKDILSGRSALLSTKDELQQQVGMKTRADWLSDAVVAGEARARKVSEGAWIAPLPVCGVTAE